MAGFELAKKVRIAAATVAEVFSFCSGLYFRGKVSYARRFANPPTGMAGVQIITPSRGLIPAETLVGLEDLREFSTVPVDANEIRFTAPLRASARIIAKRSDCEFVLLGSVATGKYVDTLLPFFGERLLFPTEFVGRGDMSRGGLLLRCVSSGEELDYVPIDGAVRRGRRPPKLAPVERKLPRVDPATDGALSP